MLRRGFLQLSALPLLPPAKARPTALSCIFLNLTGGPAHLDTWDMKPGAPSEIRGPFRPIRTNVPGIEISEIFPRMARHADKFTLIRSLYHEGPSLHETGVQLTQTGRIDFGADRPHIGSLIAASKRSEHVVLGAHTGSFGQNCTHAQRLIQSSVRFVTVEMFPTVFGETTWDSHGSQPFSTIADYRHTVGPVFDIAYSSLLENLDRAGLLRTTLVVATGEFGRTPKLNPAGGRDHWPLCWTAIVAGGGVQGGRVYGSSDRTGAEPKDNPVHASRLAATVCHAMGVQSQLEAEPLRQLFA